MLYLIDTLLIHELIHGISRSYLRKAKEIVSF